MKAALAILAAIIMITLGIRYYQSKIDVGKKKLEEAELKITGISELLKACQNSNFTLRADNTKIEDDLRNVRESLDAKATEFVDLGDKLSALEELIDLANSLMPQVLLWKCYIEIKIPDEVEYDEEQIKIVMWVPKGYDGMPRTFTEIFLPRDGGIQLCLMFAKTRYEVTLYNTDEIAQQIIDILNSNPEFQEELTEGRKNTGGEQKDSQT